MSVNITDQDVEFYHDKGYLVVPGLASPEDVEELRADALRICRGEYPHPNLEPMGPELSDDDVLRTVVHVGHR